jgi:pyruvate,orthophosphate dikinase
MTNPDDVEGMSVSSGLVTAKGGLVSHAAVVARGWGKPCVVSCSGVDFYGPDNDIPDSVSFNGTEILEGESIITIDGTTGEVFVKE